MNFEDAMEEIKNYKISKKQGFFTEQQKKFVLSARKEGMTFKKIVELWNQVDGWKKLARSTISDHYKEIDPNVQSE